MTATQPNKKKQPKAKKYLGQTGYTLHASRFSYTGVGAMRSIKYPLFHTDQLVYNNLCEKIISDYKLVQGATNLESFLADEDSYSLIDFWVDSLRAGVVFQPTEARMSAFLSVFYKTQDKLEMAFSKMDGSLRKKLDYQVFKQKILLSSGLRPTSKFTNFLKCFKSELQKDAEVVQLAKQIFSSLLPDGVALSQSEQKAYWQSQWNLTLPNKDQTASSSVFFLLPELLFDRNMSFGQCLDQRRQLFPDQIMAILGFENTFSAFSNYYGQVVDELRNGNIKKIEEIMLGMAPVWSDRDAELHARIEFLSEKAKLLPVGQLARYPGYRTNFGGKLQGWFSNYEAQIKKISEQINQSKEAIEKAINDVRSADVSLIVNDAKLSEARKISLLDNLEKLKQFQKHISNENNKDFVTLELFRDLLTYVRTDLNWIYQNYLQTEKEKREEKTVESRYKGLFMKLKLVPEFFGDSRKKKFAKYRDQTVLILRDGQVIIEKLKVELLKSPDYSFVDQEFFVKQLQKMLDKLQTKSWNTKKYQLLVTDVVKKYNQGTVPGKQQAFYLSPYARNKRSQVIQINEKLNWGSELAELIKNITLNFSLDQNLFELQDWLEVQKWIMGWLLRVNPNLELDTKNWPTKAFTKALAFQKQFGNLLTGGSRSYFLNSLIFSEIRGAASLFSREEITMRYVVQPIASLNNYPLVLKTKDDKVDLTDKKALVTSSHRWYLATQKPIRKKDSTFDSENGLITEDKAGKKFSVLKNVLFDPASLFEIRTSRYQLHFLNRLLYTGRKWQGLGLVASDHSLIVEDTYRVNWNLHTGQPSLKKMDGKRQLYVSVPFNIEPIFDTNEKEEIEDKIKNGRKRYLGIDVGEYGLAWVVLDFTNPTQPERLDQGFIFNNALRKIKDRAEEIKEIQVTGTFTVPSTKLAKVRENVITSLRNQVHDLVIKYDAKPIYEYSISNFETGSNRTTKIYKSVKVSDVAAENDTDNSIRAHVWGSKYIAMGNHISAYATSYTCGKCGRSIYEQGLDSQSEVKRHLLKKVTGRVITIQLQNQALIYGYLPPKKEETIFPKPAGSQLSDKEVYNLVKNFARPPLDKSETLAFVRTKKPEFLPESAVRNLQETRGNSSIFICPFVNCLHISDADIQAAQNIALRGYLKDQEPEKSRKERENKKESFDYIGAVREYLSTAKLEEVDLKLKGCSS